MRKDQVAIIVIILAAIIIPANILSQSLTNLPTVTGRVLQVIHNPNVGELVEIESNGKQYQFGLGTINNRDPGIQITKAWKNTLNKLKKGDEVTIEYNELQGYYGAALRIRLNRQPSSTIISQSSRQSSVKKTAIVTYEGDGPQGMYKFGTIYFRINDEVKLFAWDSNPSTYTRFINNTKPKAYDKGAVWRIVYSSSIKNRDMEEANFHLWSATFTGRVNK